MTAPLSFPQQRLWFLDQLLPGNTAYNISWAVRLRGPLDLDALTWTLGRIVARHEALRTRFPATDGEPEQVVEPAAPVTLAVVECQDEDAVRREIRADIATPFELRTAPPLRMRLLRLGTEDHVLSVVVHHILVDGWSTRLFFGELASGYAARVAGQPDPLAPLPVQYRDVARAQRTEWAGDGLARTLGWWREHLAGAPTLLNLPTDRPRPAVQTFAGATHQVELPARLWRAVAEAGRPHKATPFMVLHAALSTLLHRLTGASDLVLGSPMAGRTKPEHEQLIGMFTTTLPMRIDLAGDPTGAELLDRTRTMALGAFAHADLPFEKLVEELQPERVMSHNPLVQVMLTLQNTQRSAAGTAQGGLDIEHFPMDLDAAFVDLWLEVRPPSAEDDPALLRFTYKTDLFDAATVARIAGQYETVLRDLTERPDTPVSRLRLLSAADHAQVVGEFGAPAPEPAVTETLAEVFERSAASTPDAVAATRGDRAVTYARLNRAANRLARTLRAEGVGPDVLVGICAGRDLELLVATLAVLKAGGAYVPLDPANPDERLRFVIADTGTRLLLTEDAQADRFADFAGEVRLLDGCLDDGIEGIDAATDPGNLPSAATPDNLAYVIYTSGSTGRPKGVMIAHRQVVRLMTAADEHFEFGPDDVWAMVHSHAFDLSVWEMWGAWGKGGRLAVVPADTVRDGEALHDLLRDERVTVLTQTPPAFRALRAAMAATGRSFLDLPMRYVVFGGDALHVREFEDWFAEHGDTRPAMINMYGITETTVHTTFWQLTAADLVAPPSSPVGRALPDLYCHVLDQHLQPVPVGVPGELFVAGPGLARGYLNRPGLTADRFLPEPFGGRPGARMYRSGDLVKWLPDGNLEYLGRVDRQVKIRGYRVEPGEIESAMLEHPTVGDAVVLPRTDRHGQLDLVGYVTPRQELVDDLVSRSSEAAVGGWGEVFDLAFGGETDPFAGWTSSYTGQPIEREAMTAWLDDAVSRIKQLRPRRILDVGCGTGLFLERLAAGCERYVGTDLSAAALATAHKRAEVAGLGQVELHQLAADELGELASRGERFDVVLLDSVAQYFPSVDYLLRVLDGIVALVEPGGYVFVGDVRHHGLLEAFHVSVERFRATGSEDSADDRSELRDRVARRIGAENELLVDPALFRALPARLPRIGGVDVLLQRGWHGTEMERFRYDVLLRVEPPDRGEPAGQVPWTDTERFRRWLTEQRPAAATVSGIPNARVADDLRAAAVLADPQAAPEDAPAAADPEDLAEIAEALGYRVWPRWSADPGRFDLTVTASGDLTTLPPEQAAPVPDRLDWTRFANFCLRDRWEAEVLPALRTHLADRLPSHMVPARFVVLDRFPLNRSGKIDRGKLPPPSAERMADETFAAPRDETERLLASIWAEILGLTRVSITDDFFAVGGDSLRSVQVVGRARAEGLVLSARELFEHPTIAELATVARRADTTPVTVSPTIAQKLLAAAGDPVRTVDVTATGPLDPALLDAALAFLVRRHDVLRLAPSEDGDWSPVAVEPSVQWLDITDQEALRAAALDQMAGGVLAVAGAGAGEPEPRLVLAVNRVALDEHSVGVLLDELGIAYRQLTAGAAIRLPGRPTGFAAWAAERPEDDAVCPDSLAPGSRGDRVVELVPPPEQVAALTGPLAEAYRMSPAEALLAATLYGARGPGFTAGPVLVRHRRDTVARGLGRFDEVDSLPGGPAGTIDERLSALKESLRTPSPATSAEAPAVMVHAVAEHAPDPAALLRIAPGPVAVDRVATDADVLLSFDGHRVAVRVAGPAAVEVAARIEAGLAELAEHASVPDVGSCTPSDFPLAGLDQATLRAVFGTGRHIEDVHPVGPQQDWMLRTYEEQADRSLYGFDLTFVGEDIDPDLWVRAWEMVTARQPTLRAGFRTEGVPQPLIVVHREVPVRVHTEDWRELDVEEQGRRWYEYMDRSYREGFDLAEPGHSRHALFRVGPSTYWWTWFVNYLMFDGISFYRALNEAETVYHALRAGRDPDLPEVVEPARYVEWFSRRDLTPALAYWRSRLAGFTAPTPLAASLGTDPSAPARPQRTGRATMLNRRQSTALRITARRHQLTLYTLFQAAWSLLLHDTTGHTDVLFGNAVAGRPDELPGADHVVGYCNLHLPARIRVDRDQPLLRWLRELQAEQVDDRANQWVPLRRIKEVSEVAAPTLYDSCVFFMDGPLRAAPSTGTWRRVIGAANTEHPLRIVIGPAESISLSVVYNPGTFADDRMDLVLRKVMAALVTMSRSLDGTVADILTAMTDPGDAPIISRESQLLFNQPSPTAVPALDLTGG